MDMEMLAFKELSLKLAQANNESEVSSIINNSTYLNNQNNWAPYGDIDHNWDRVGNQSTDPASALTEKIVNSIDAVLMKECLKNKIEPEGEKAPKSMREAVKRFFGVYDGMLGNATQKQRETLADNIQVVVSGDKKTPCYAIIDKGEGQEPQKFPETYVSLSKKNKEGISFVQGKYNMGGSGVLSLCGNNFYQLIIAKRNQELVEDKNNNLWGFTLVRKRAPREKERLPVVEYFIIGGKDGRIASFLSNSLPLLPSDQKNLFSEPLDSGTFIKLYDYNMSPSDRSVDLGLNDALSRTMYMCSLPIYLKDTRVEKGNTWKRVFSGTDVRLENEDQGYIKKDYRSSIQLESSGNIPCALIPLEREVNWMRKYSVLYIINGQVHAHETLDFLDKAKLTWLRKRLIIIADCTDIDKDKSPLIFKADRGSMTDRPEAKKLRQELRKALEHNPRLKELNKIIHQETVISIAKDDADVKKLFSQLAQNDPNLAALFNPGEKLKTFIKDQKGKKDEFKGLRFPTILKPLKVIKEGFFFEIPKGESRFIKAHTDVENDYLMRAREKGKLITEKPEEWTISCTSLNNGIANFKIDPSDNVKAGYIYELFIGFTDNKQITPLGFKLNVKIVDPNTHIMEKDNNKPKEIKDDKYKEKFSRNMPDIKEVYEDQWDNFDIDEKSGFDIKIKPGTNEIEIFVNMANIYYKQFLLKYKKESENEIIKKQYMAGMGLMGCALWNLIKNKDNKEDVISIASSAVAQIILSAIRGLGKVSTASASDEYEVEE